MRPPDVELEERLSRLGPAFKDGIKPPATLHITVMAVTSAPPTPARRSMLREVSLAAAVIAFVALLAFGFSRLHSVTPGPIKPSPSPSPASRVIPWISATPVPLKLQTPKTLSVDQAAQDIRQTVTDPYPVLLPRTIPSGFQAQLYDDAGSFSVMYLAGDGRFIQFSIVIPNPPPGNANVRQSKPVFHGVQADYQVDDAATPNSSRWLMWNEPGTPYDGMPGVPYFLRTDGFTESEFWTIANSIGPIPAQVTSICRPADLYIGSSGSNGATGHVLYSVAITNHGKTACSLVGFPVVSLVTAQGKVLSLQEEQMAGGWAGSPPSPAVLPPDQPAPTPHTVSDGAYFTFEWYYCGATPPDLTAADITFPDTVGVRRVALLHDGPQIPSRCDDPSQGRKVLVGPVERTNAQTIDVTAPALRVTLAGIPGTLIAGQTLHYQVTITNDSASAISFDTCPAYDEGFTSNGMVSYLLNCAPLGRLDPGASATFAMEFTIPPFPKSPTGQQKFLWRLHGAYAGASAGTLITVTAS